MKTLCLRLICVLACLFAAPRAAGAADLTVAVTDAAGKPVAAAVVAYTPRGGAQISDRSGAFVMAQKNIKFAPYVLAVPVGATVNFPNQDRVNHHVYSFSPVQPFQFPLYGQGKTRTLKFDHAGTVAIACNIHDSMSAYIRVVDTPYFATTDASGRVTLTNLPAGAGTLSVWQPMMDAPEHLSAKPVSIAATNAPVSFAVKVRAQALPASGAY